MGGIRCPKHDDQSASCWVYDDHAFCFAGCGRIELTEFGLETADRTPKEKYVENLKEKLDYISSLPTKLIRGFNLPYDDLGYYLVWGGGDYYKLRFWDPDCKSKYRGPSGHPKPVFWARRDPGSSTVSTRTLVLVEGEYNSLSMVEAFPEWDILSPGSASDFKTSRFTKYLLTLVRYYRTLIIVTDRDGAGTEAAIHTKGFLLNKAPNIHIVLMERDANDIYVHDGKEKLREEVERHLPKL